MKIRLLAQVLTVGTALQVGCAASSLHVAQEYENAGLHEWALPYFGRHYLEDPSDSAKERLERSFDLAVRNLEAADPADPARTVALALREQDLKLQLRGFGLAAAADSGTAVSADVEGASKAALKRLDKAEIAKASPFEILKLTREALAFAPNNAELSDRYERLRSSLTRALSIEDDCPPEARRVCELVRTKVQAGISEFQRELVDVVPPRAKSKSATLTLSLSIRVESPRWQPTESGVAEATVQAYDRFQSPIPNEFWEVRAPFQCFQARSAAVVNGKVRVQDLRPPVSTLVELSLPTSRERTAQHCQYEGDVRAFSATTFVRKEKDGTWEEKDNEYARIRQMGTDRTLPPSPDALLDEIANDLASSTLSAVLAQLDPK